MQTSATPESSLESTCASAAPSATPTCTPNPICHEGVPHPAVRLVINGSSGLEVQHQRPDSQLAIDICCDDIPDRKFRILLTSRRKRFLLPPAVSDTPELEQLRDVVVGDNRHESCAISTPPI